MNHPVRALSLLCFIAICADGQGSPQSPPVIRSTSRLVQVNVVVHDRDGNPVRDLRREDFVLRDHGSEQQIALFEAFVPESSAPAAAEPGVLTNRAASKRVGSATIILVDSLNTHVHDLQYARMQTLQFFSQLRPDDKVAVYFLADRLYVVQDFTADSRALLESAQKLKANPSALNATQPGDLEALADEADEDLQAALRRMALFYTERRVEKTVAAIEAIANHVSYIPGRKSLVWISSSFPFTAGFDAQRNTYDLSPQTRVFSSEAERAARALNSAAIAIYPVDARGLVGSFGGRVPSRIGSPLSSATTSLAATHDTMVLLADRTGGVSFRNSNDIAGAIRRAVDDGAYSYTLSFYPTHNRWDGRWRELKVQVQRKGVSLRHRRGYFASDDEPTPSRQRTDLLWRAANSPVEAASIGVSARPSRQDASGQRSLVVDLAIAPQDVSFTREGNLWHGDLDIYFAQRAGTGRQLKYVNYTLAMRLPDATYERVLREGIELRRVVELHPEAVQVRLVVHDSRTGKTGTLAIPCRDSR